jgi:hypothetical protein
MAGLLDFLQSASNESAGAVSAPVDAIAWLLRRAGVLGSKLGYKAVEMPDEHGTSYLITGGAKPRPANESAKQLVRAAVKK